MTGLPVEVGTKLLDEHAKQYKFSLPHFSVITPARRDGLLNVVAIAGFSSNFNRNPEIR
jgi:hypothetical protein